MSFLDRRARAVSSVVLWSVSLLVTTTCTALATDDGARPLLVTVDDLPLSPGLHPDPAERERITRGMLTALAAHEIRAVGLVTCGNITGPEDVRLLASWLEAGHELGNHSTSHLDYTRTPTDEYVRDVEACRERLRAILGERGADGPRFFRYPFLREGDSDAKLRAMRRYLDESGQRDLPVTIDNQDWSFERPWVEAERRGDADGRARVADAYHESLHVSVRHHERTSERLFERPVPEILLLHASAIGAAEWDRLFAWLADGGHRFAGPDEVLSDPAYAEPHRYLGRYGPGLWDRLLDERRRASALVEVRALLDEQSEAWSRGDIEGFTSVYSGDALFVSPSGVTRGRAEVLDRYRKRYPGPEAMGRLVLEPIEMRALSGVEVSMLGDARPGRVHAVTVAARWTLSYPGQAERNDATGVTLIVLRKSADGWRIVQDASM